MTHLPVYRVRIYQPISLERQNDNKPVFSDIDNLDEHSRRRLSIAMSQ